MAEIWKPIEGYEGVYDVSDAGKVRSLARSSFYLRNGRAVHGAWKERILKPFYNHKSRTPYLYVNLCLEGVCEKHAVHIVVCNAFGGRKCGTQQVVRHLNGDPFDNRASNLCWGTSAENYADMAAHDRSPRGVRASKAKITEETVRFIRSQRGIVNGAILAKQIGIHRNNLYKIWRREIWVHVTD